MKQRVSQRVRTCFDQLIKSRFGNMSLCKSGQLRKGDLLYHFDVGNRPSRYLHLQLHTSEDWFTIDVGWSEKGRYPGHLVGLAFPVSVPALGICASEPIDGELRFRIGFLWPPYQDYWWRLDQEHTTELPPEAHLDMILAGQEVPDAGDLLISERVADALDRVSNYVVPYFESLRQSS